MDKSGDERLYLVWLEDAEGAVPEPGETDDPGLMPLAKGLFLVRTNQTRSELYHAVKRRTKPEKLLVAPLADAPKFKGLADGALKWVRSHT